MADVVPAATVILVREPYEVYLVRRHHKSGFMADAFVFPGGKLDAGETPEQAACRELEEEASVRVAREDLVPWALWITPAFEPRRFAAHFFLARLPAGQTAAHDARETTEELWITPREAVLQQSRGEIKLPPPTLHNLEQMSDFDSTGALFAAARARVVTPILPKFMPLAGSALALLLPWDPQYGQTAGDGVDFPAEHPLRATSSRIILRDGKWWSRAI